MSELKRLAIFAGYDKDNIIDDYVVYYIKELKKIADIIYVSDCNMLDSELEKISPYCIHIMNGRHGEYDFGSYKKGFWYARLKKLIFNYDYLLLCNDSVYGPFYDLKKIMEDMEKKDLDAWSMFYCFYDYANLSHLQSYFISIKKDVFLKENFTYFMMSIMRLNTKENMIVYNEVGLTNFFKNNNYKIGGYFDSSTIKTDKDGNLPFYKTEDLIKIGFPFFKRSILEPLLRLETFNFTIDNWNNILDTIKNNYDTNLMKSNVERVLNIDFNTLLPKINKINKNIALKSNKKFILFGLETDERYITIYVFGIKLTIKK